MAAVQKIRTFLWFDGKAEEAAEHYTKVFRDSKVTHVARYGDAGPGPKGQAMVVEFTLAGQQFVALNGGPDRPFTDAVSLFVDCDDQAEVDRLWDYFLSDGGQPQACGWLNDKYGLRWQIIPRRLMELMYDKDPAKTARVMQAMMQMIKIDVPTLERAYAGD